MVTSRTVLILSCSFLCYGTSLDRTTEPVVCSDLYFKCDNKCIPHYWQCDGEIDCMDGSDEDDIKCQQLVCKDSEFKCDNNRCIHRKWLCDGENDCKDGSDEDDSRCQPVVCPDSQFKCDNLCIPRAWLCDGGRDCKDGSDEDYGNCSKNCSSNEFSCANSKCVPQRWVCDHEDDCGDGSDERNCPLIACDPKLEFTCGINNTTSTVCVHRYKVCDGYHDCPDGADEKNCSKIALPTCSSRKFTCPNGRRCVDMAWVCDGMDDCHYGGGDERPELCSTGECRPQQFRCKSRGCIANSLRCNGLVDCPDGSDEVDCGSRVRCDLPGVFDCGGGHCIAKESICDGKADCSKGQDEPRGQCGVNECLVNNGNCSQTCVDTAISFHCACAEGYKLGSDGKSCEDLDECGIPGSCSQICHNEYGTYRCDCEEGYVTDPVNNRKCRAAVGNASLILTNKFNILKIPLDHQKRSFLVNDTQFATSIDFIYSTGVLFWHDNMRKKISKATMKEGNNQIEIIGETNSSITGLAVDWIYNHIYWTVYGENNSSAVWVANLDGSMRTSLITDRLDSPATIVVNPSEGWLFWSDCGEVAKIERAGLDGSQREIIVSSDLRWPLCLTLDFVQRRIYWADTILHVISSCDYDGSRRRQILHDEEALYHPLSIVVFEDYLYWTNIIERTIRRANKFNASDVIMFDMTLGPMELKVYHPYTQPEGVNHCGHDNGNCSHLCLPAPQVDQHSPKTTCACPDGLTLMPGGLKCTGNATAARMERSFVMINPDGVRRGLVGKVIKRLMKKEFNLVGLKMAQLTEDLVKTHYVDLSSNPFFIDLAKNVSSGSVVYMVWEGFNVVNTTRSILGTAYPQESAPGSISGDVGVQTGSSMVYGSESVESAEEEISLWFEDSEIHSLTSS